MTTLIDDPSLGLVVKVPWTCTLPKGVKTNCDAWSQVSQTLLKWGAKVDYGAIYNQNPHGPLRVVRDGVSLIIRKRQAYPIELFTNGARTHDGLKIAIMGNYGRDAEKQKKNAAIISKVGTAIVRRTLPGGDDKEFVLALTKLCDEWKELASGDAPAEPYIVALLEDCPMVKPSDLQEFLKAHHEIRAVDVHKVGDRARDWKAAAERATGENGWTFACGLAKLRISHGGDPMFTIKDRDHTKPGQHVENVYPGFVDWESVDPSVLKVVKLHPADEGPLRREIFRVSLPTPWMKPMSDAEMAIEILRKVGAHEVAKEKLERELTAACDELGPVPFTKSLKSGSPVTQLPRAKNEFAANYTAFGPGVPVLNISLDATLKFKIAQAISAQDPEAALGPVLRHLVVSESGPEWAAHPEVTPATIRSVCGDIVSQAYSELRQARRDPRDYHSNRAAKRYTLGILGPGAARTWGEILGDVFTATASRGFGLGFQWGVGLIDTAAAYISSDGFATAFNRAPLRVLKTLDHPGPGEVHTLGAMYGPGAGEFARVQVLGSSSNQAAGAEFPAGVRAIPNPLASPGAASRCVGIMVGVRVCKQPAICDVRSYDAVASAVRKSVAAPPSALTYADIGLEGSPEEIEMGVVARILQGVGALGKPWGMDYKALREDEFLSGLRKASLRAKYLEGKELYFSGIDDFDPTTGLIRSPMMPKFERKKPVAEGVPEKEDRLIANVGPVDYFRSALVNCEAAHVIVCVGGLPPREERCDKAWGTKKAREVWGPNAVYVKLPLDEAGADSARCARHFRMYARFLIDAGILDHHHPYYEFLMKIACSKLYSELLKICVDHAHLLSGHSGTWSIQTFMRLVFAVVHMELVCGFKPEEYALEASGDDLVMLALVLPGNRRDRKGRRWFEDASVRDTGLALGMNMTIEGPAVPEGYCVKFLGGDEIETGGFLGAPDDVVNIPDFMRSCVSLSAIPVNVWDLPSIKGRLKHMQQAWMDRFCWEKYGVSLPVLGAIAQHNYHRAQYLLDFGPGRVGAIRAIGDELWSRVDSYRPVRRWLPLPAADHWLREVCADVWGIAPDHQIELERSLARLTYDRDYDLSDAWELSLAARYVPPAAAGPWAPERQ